MPPATFAAGSEPETHRATGVVLICNRKAGAGADNSSELLDLLQAAGLQVEPLAEAGMAPQEAARAAVQRGAKLIVAAGGDGTISSVAAVVSETEATLGVLPTGTLNHFAKDLGIPTDLKEAAEVIARGKSQSVDTAEVNGRVFINNSSLGLYPRFAMYKEEQRKLGHTRLFSLAWALATVVRRIPFLRVRFHAANAHLDRKTPLLFFGNNEYSIDGAGTRKTLSDGKLCVHIVNARNWRTLVGLSFRLLLRRWKPVEEIESLSTTEALVESNRPKLRVSCDGEVEWMETPLQYRIRPASLRVMVP